MSRVTRSTAAMLRNSNDENAAPKQMLVKRSGLGGGLKNSAPVANTRRVLGDISNRIKAPVNEKNVDQQLNKKKKVVIGRRGSNQGALVEKAPVATKTSTSSAERRRSLDRMVDDVDMAPDSDTSVEVSIAELKLSSVDAADAENPQAAAEFMVDIMKNMLKAEPGRVASNSYMSKQSDINAKMREILIDWLVEVHLKFKLRDETLFLTVNLIDRFLERRAVSRTKLQLVGCTAMLIASKYEEIYAPEVRDFVYISDKAYTRDQILAMESIMLNTLGFHVTVPTVLRFTERFCKVSQANETTSQLANYLIELTLQDYKFLKFLPSQIAATAVMLAHKMTGNSNPWNSTLEKHTTYTESDLSECFKELAALHNKEPAKYRAVRKKYTSSKFREVAKIESILPKE